ncbi:MAG: threonine/serine dehydratase, partial [Erythrobacter sp.]
MTERTPTREGVIAAAESVAAILPPTPLLPVTIGGVQAWVKAETLQPIGSFKIRGAWWRLSNLTPEERRAGVVAVSSGNHAQGVAWSGRRLGVPATIVMPHDAPQVKLANTRALGAEVVLYQRPAEDRDAVAAKLIAERGGTLVHAFGDPWVIEGQGSAAIEIAAQLGRAPSRIIACCGGG